MASGYFAGGAAPDAMLASKHQRLTACRIFRAVRSPLLSKPASHLFKSCAANSNHDPGRTRHPHHDSTTLSAWLTNHPRKQFFSSVFLSIDHFIFLKLASPRSHRNVDFMLAGLRRHVWPVAMLLGGCSVNDAHTALHAQTALLGFNEVALQTCMGVPDQKAVFGKTEILTYDATSTSSTSFTIPLIGGVGTSFGGYCHTVIRLDNGLVDGVRYVGETNAFIAPDAYCAPSVRGCLSNPPPATPATAQGPVAVAVTTRPRDS
jgi:hypothetical protein